MMMRFEKIVSLPSGNTARNFHFNDRGYGRVQVTYEYTDRRRNHQTARRFTVEFLNGKIESITARSARGGRVEAFSTSTIINELRSMLAEFIEASQDVAQHRYAKVEAPAVNPEQDDTANVTSADLMDTLKTVEGMIMVTMVMTMLTLGIVWCNL